MTDGQTFEKIPSDYPDNTRYADICMEAKSGTGTHYLAKGVGFRCGLKRQSEEIGG